MLTRWWSWTIGTAEGIEDAEARDDADARLLYELLERELVPSFYAWDSEGVSPPSSSSCSNSPSPPKRRTVLGTSAWSLPANVPE